MVKCDEDEYLAKKFPFLGSPMRKQLICWINPANSDLFAT